MQNNDCLGKEKANAAKKLSIIIPYYNKAQKLERLLKSIPNIPEIQVIVVNDCSTENKDYYDRIRLDNEARVDFYDNEVENKSAGGARNIGLKYAVGKYVLFADSDDFFVDGWYSHVDEYLTSDLDIIYFAPCSINDENNDIGSRHVEPAYLVYQVLNNKDEKKIKFSELNIRYRWSSPWSKLIKNELIKKYNIQFAVRNYSEDVPFSSKSGFMARKIGVSHKTIYCITESSDSLTAVESIEKSTLGKNAVVEHFNYWNDNLSFQDACILFQYTGIKKIKCWIKKCMFGK